MERLSPKYKGVLASLPQRFSSLTPPVTNNSHKDPATGFFCISIFSKLELIRIQHLKGFLLLLRKTIIRLNLNLKVS